MNNDQSHSVVEKLRLLAPWVEPDGARLVAPAATALPAEFAAALRPPYAVLQAPAAVAYKLWPLAHWRALVAALLERGLQVVLTGAPSAGDQALVEVGAQRLRRRSRPRRRRPARPEPGRRRCCAAPRSTSAATPRSPTWRRRARFRSSRCTGRSTRATSGPGRRTRRSRFPTSRTPWCSAPAASASCRERRPACRATGPAARTATTAPASACRRSCRRG